MLYNGIRQHDRDLPIVFLTAKDADEDQVRGLEVGADDFVSKGVSIAAIRGRGYALTSV